eukprot:m.459313 g.459313  ORF g.459313 m.459313 type:complete len:432 (-) comp57005_c0_seq2:99-1394(-)
MSIQVRFSAYSPTSGNVMICLLIVIMREGVLQEPSPNRRLVFSIGISTSGAKPDCLYFVSILLLLLLIAVIESHPDNAMADLRVTRPFPALLQFVDTINFEDSDLSNHAHIPYLAILLHHARLWKASHNDTLPVSRQEKTEFQAQIRAAMLKNEDGVPLDEPNFDEALKSCNTALLPYEIPSQVRELLADPKAQNLTPQSSDFWVLVGALKEFVDLSGSLPVAGALPDMAADSARYIALQQLFFNKAREDFESMSTLVKEHLVSIGRAPAEIDDFTIKLFCKNAAFLQIVRTRSIAEEYNPETINKDSFEYCLEDGSSSVPFYLILRAIDAFYASNGRYPGVSDDDIGEDVVAVKGCVASLLARCGISHSINNDLIHEMVRCGGAELHNIAAFIGGAAAQEVIKLITAQFVPVNSTFIYNGINGTSSVIQP